MQTSDDGYVKNIKVVVSIEDEDTGDVIRTVEVKVKDGESETVVGNRIKKQVMSLLVPEEDFG